MPCILRLVNSLIWTTVPSLAVTVPAGRWAYPLRGLFANSVSVRSAYRPKDRWVRVQLPAAALTAVTVLLVS